MNLQERILAVFSGEKPDVMPWFADLVYWYRSKEYRNELPNKYQGERGRIRLYKDLGCGSHEELYSMPGSITTYNVKRTNSEETFRDGTVVREVEFKTPVGSISLASKFVPKSVSSGVIKHPVATRRDLKVLQYMYKNQEFTPNYSRQYDRLKNWKGVGLISSSPPRSPFQTLVVGWAGVVNVLRLMMREPEELDETIQVMSDADDPIYEAICNSPTPSVYFGENLTSDVISPPIFRRYHMPYYEKRTRQLHAAGKFIFIHIDGTLRGLLPLMEKTGVDCAQSVTPAPVGDIPVEKLREAAGPNIILWGGLPGAYFSRLYPEKTIPQMAMKVINHHLQGYKFIMGVADQVPPDGDIKRVKMVTNLIDKHAKYD